MKKRVIAVFIIVTLIISFSGCSAFNLNAFSSDHLKSWTEDSENRQKIIEFVNAVTDKSSKDYVPPEDRVATFDMDGTIVCEEPIWLELAVAEYRILNDMKDNQKLIDEVNTLNEYLKQYPEPAETGQLINDVVSQASYNMPQEDFVAYMEKFMQNERPDFVDLKYKDSFYKPMIELIEYLLDKDFQVYIVSGSERGVIWGACKEALPKLSRAHEIGSDIVLKATNQSDPSDISYMFQKDDKLIRQLGFTQSDLKMGKVLNIYHQIGIKPILAFGNTDGDFSMLNYAKSNEKYKNIAFLLCHDDDKREYNYHIEERYDWNNKAEANDWNVVYMSKEFKQVFMKETEKK